MFSWFKRKLAAAPVPIDSGAALAHRLTEALRTAGYAAQAQADCVELEAGFRLRPQVVSLDERSDGGAQTCTTIAVAHPSLLPQGLFEFQHACGKDAPDAFTQGFESWARLDLPVYFDALASEPKDCMYLAFGRRRIVLGPAAYLAAQPAAQEGEHPFCPCCLFTNALEALRPLLERETTHGLRLFAMRNAEGGFQADCRVDGEDWPAGAAALVEYARTWPGTGLEFRKQYVLMHTPEQAGD